MLDSLNKKTIIIAGGSIVGLIVLLLVGSFLVTILVPKTYTYEQVEGMISEAAKQYYADNPTSLPKEDGETTLYYDTLVQGGYIRPLADVLENGEGCTANAIISKYSEYFSYIPFLSCPGDYETKELFRTVLNDNRTVTEGVGLYNINSRYIFRGEVTNNYVQINNELWRIMTIENDNTMKVIRTVKTETQTTWDDRYNVDKKSSVGYNTFEISRLKEALQRYSGTEEIIPEALKGKFTAKNLCVGARAEDSLDLFNTEECGLMSEDKFIFGTITAGDYYQISVDPDCLTVSKESCMNYNYLTSIRSSTWTLTPQKESTHRAFYYGNSVLDYGICSTQRFLYLTGYLSNRAFYNSGTGTESDPYIMK